LVNMGSQRDGRSVGVRANVEDFAEAGVNEDPCAVDEDCRAVVSTELDLPHDGVTAIYVISSAVRLPLPPACSTAVSMASSKGTLADRSFWTSSLGVLASLMLMTLLGS
jgi:hypothetical protein